MIVKMFAIYDSKAEAYNQPLFMQSRGVAIRAFMDAANDPECPISKYPADYTLFEIGEFDNSTAVCSSHVPKISLGTALELRRPVSAPQPLLAAKEA